MERHLTDSIAFTFTTHPPAPCLAVAAARQAASGTERGVVHAPSILPKSSTRGRWRTPLSEAERLVSVAELLERELLARELPESVHVA